MVQIRNVLCCCPQKRVAIIVTTTTKLWRNYSIRSSKQSWTARRNEIFEREVSERRNRAKPLQKVMVTVRSPTLGTPLHKDLNLLMNRNLSRPYDCAKHVSGELIKQSMLAKTCEDGENCKVTEMHEPISSACDIQFLTNCSSRNPQDAHIVNKAFWRSCSFILGAVLDSTFKDSYRVLLHSWPGADYKSGSFVYDVKIEGLQQWIPSPAELDSMSRAAVSTFVYKNYAFEPLEVNLDVAKAIFSDNPLKEGQLESIASERNGFVRIYRLGNHIDISNGPLISKSSQIGRFSITKMTALTDGLYRFQGVALPFSQRLGTYTWEVIRKAATRTNRMPTPDQRLKEQTVGSYKVNETSSNTRENVNEFGSRTASIYQ